MKEGRKEMLYLTTHSTHFNYGYMENENMESETEKKVPPHELHFPISNNSFFICKIPQMGEHMPLLLFHLSWNISCNEK